MYTVLYKCAYREHWYDDFPEYDSLDMAAGVAEYVAQRRGTVAVVMDAFGVQRYVADWRV